MARRLSVKQTGRDGERIWIEREREERNRRLQCMASCLFQLLTISRVIPLHASLSRITCSCSDQTPHNGDELV